MPEQTLAQLCAEHDSEIHVLSVVGLQAAGGVFDAGGFEQEFVECLEARGQGSVERVANEIEQASADVAVQTAVERKR